jgi:hypothetical protein
MSKINFDMKVTQKSILSMNHILRTTFFETKLLLKELIWEIDLIGNSNYPINKCTLPTKVNILRKSTSIARKQRV